MSPLWAGLLDDAAGLTGPVPAAVAGYAARTGPARELTGSLLVRDVDLPTALRGGVPVTVVSTGGAGALAGPLRLADRAGVPLAGLHTTLREPGDLVGTARRVVAALDAAADEGLLPDDLTVTVEVPPVWGLEAALDVLAERELVWGLRLPPSPDPAEVAGWLDAALDRETPYVVWGVEHALAAEGRPGLLGLLAATRLAFDGASHDEVTRALVDTGAVAEDAAGRARRWLRSCVVGSVDAVTAELTTAGALGS